MAICQLALPPYTMTCTDCHHIWNPRSARGDAPTATSLDKQARDHMRGCEGKPPANPGG